MKFPVKDTLTEEEVENGLRSVIKDGLTTQTMVTLTGGVFLVAFALKLGASNIVIGLLAAIPPLAHLIQIPAIYLVEKYRVRRAITVYAAALSRIFWLLIALIPFLFSIEAGLIFLIIALLLHSAFAAVGGCSWNSWMHDLVPQRRLGSFFSKRMSFAMALAIPLSLAAGVFIDYWGKSFVDYELYGFSILFFLGFLAGMLGVYFISTIPEPRMALSEKKTGFFKLILQPFKDSNFKQLIMFLGSWNFAVNLAAPFFTVYMLKRLEFDMSFIIALLVLSQIMNLAFLRIWGRFSDRFSNKSVLGVSGPLFMLCILAWTFTTLPEKYFLTTPLLIVIHIFMGISTAGVSLASGNIGLKLAPKGQATSYLAANGLINSLAAGTAPILGGIFADFFAERELSMTLKWIDPEGELVIQTLNLQQWDFFFFLAFLIGLYSIHRLAMVKEVGEVETKIVLNELISEAKRETRSLSTVSGLRQMVYFPFSLVTHLKRRKK
ncbi:MAG: MFS transporter [Candidatus Altiarchaeales archaeon WOR_SM1_86-2]|nr:MAG: MFS transporter [Candidatus Altiarchaeales archaeon WOR_SM1_86-2]ODS41721.1 MAG: MFS transporter [Candidatus Altiarchaeales archaeon WOR_SM1_79]